MLARVKTASPVLRLAAALGFGLLVSQAAPAMDGASASGAPDPRAPVSDATPRSALPFVCAPRKGSPAAAAAGFALATAGAAVLSRRRTDRLR
jgi:hypothetical protein